MRDFGTRDVKLGPGAVRSAQYTRVAMPTTSPRDRLKRLAAVAWAWILRRSAALSTLSIIVGLLFLVLLPAFSSDVSVDDNALMVGSASPRFSDDDASFMMAAMDDLLAGRWDVKTTQWMCLLTRDSFDTRLRRPMLRHREY